jgi:hypothetical protein
MSSAVSRNSLTTASRIDDAFQSAPSSMSASTGRMSV